jgi:peptidoglycan/xylan/chitin deacetylase (PgdA/CDA1 family)
MSKASIFLTIDDSPSIHTKDKLKFLFKHKIQAIFFCRGEFIEQYPEYVEEIIKKGHLVGNHSYSHPFFSKSTLENFCNEILKTEELIEKAYEKSGIKRPLKVIRLPFGDRGGSQKDIESLQFFLRNQNFICPQFDNLSLGPWIDVGWTWDTLDYKKKFLENIKDYLEKFHFDWVKNKENSQILLVHDFEHNHHLFEPAINYLILNGCNFKNII